MPISSNSNKSKKPKVIIVNDKTFTRKNQESNSEEDSLSDETMECMRLAYPEHFRDTDDSFRISTKSKTINPNESDEEEYSANFLNNITYDPARNNKNGELLTDSKERCDDMTTPLIQRRTRNSKNVSKRQEVKLVSQNESSEENEYCFDDFGGADLKRTKFTENKRSKSNFEKSKSSSDYSKAKEDYTNCDSMNTNKINNYYIHNFNVHHQALLKSEHLEELLTMKRKRKRK